VADEMLVDGVPVRQSGAIGVVRDGADHDVKAVGQPGQIDPRGPVDEPGTVHPGLA
jgi:hypothetical protein